MKKLLSVLLVALMLVSVVGCGKGNGNKKDSVVYTYQSYQTSLGSVWNPHTWQTNADNSMLSWVSTPFADMTIEDSTEGVYQWIFMAATAVTDVTAQHRDDLVKYGSTLPAYATSWDDVKDSMVYEIALRPEMKWQDGRAITAKDYIESAKLMLDPRMGNTRADSYIANESAIAGAYNFYFSLQKGLYNVISWADVPAYQAAGKEVYVDVWDAWGAQGYTDADGNEVAQYLPITDETVYGEAQEDAFSAKFLVDNYTPYFESGDIAVFEYVVNENYNENWQDSFDQVGLYAVDDYTIRYVLQNAEEYNYFMTSMTSNWLVDVDKYTKGFDETTSLITTDYNTNLETTSSYGPYMMASFQNEKQVVFVKNPNWFGYTEDKESGRYVGESWFDVDGKKVELYQADKVVIDVMTDDAAKQAFLKGELDNWSPSANEMSTYALSEQLYKTDETFTMRFFFNCNLDALKAMDTSYGNTNSVVMSNKNFRKAMSLAIDRTEWVKSTLGYKPNYGILSKLYFYDVYNDPTSIYRNTDQAMQAICDLYGVSYGEGQTYATLKDAYNSINGYNLTEAKALMAEACKELVAAGLYTEGQDIVIRIGWKKGALDSTDIQQCTVVETMLNAAVEGTGFGKIKLDPIGSINDRYGAVANGEFAIGYGAWGGAAFYPFRQMTVYMDPSKSQGALHEGGCWDPTVETLTLEVNGEKVTMTYTDWSNCMIGSGKYANADFDAKLTILSYLEKDFLGKFYCIPLAQSTSCELISYKIKYYTEDYNIMYGFGGLMLTTFNYTDAEWASYVSQNNGTLSYE